MVSLAAACGGGPAANGTGGVDMNETAATVNGKPIKMEEVERAIKQQAQGQESKLSALELASARLQVLQGLVETEVMFQKAEKEGKVPTDEEITTEVNKQKAQSGKSADEIAKQMQEAGMTEDALRQQVKKQIAIQRLVDSITGKIEQPKDAEIEAFYNGNKDAFVKKRGVKLAAIVIDPSNSGEGDTTIDEQSAVLKANDVIKRLQSGQEFGTLAQQFSEDQSRFQNGDLGYIAEDDMKQSFPEQLTATLMSPQSEIGKIYSARMNGKLYILKLQDRSDKDEQVTLDTPGIRQQVIDQLLQRLLIARRKRRSIYLQFGGSEPRDHAVQFREIRYRGCSERHRHSQYNCPAHGSSLTLGRDNPHPVERSVHEEQRDQQE